MFSAVESQVAYRIANAAVLDYPFPHFYATSVFPEEYYRALRDRLPAADRYRRLDETGTVAKGAYPERTVCSLSEVEESASADGGPFWRELEEWIMSDRFAGLLMEKFRAPIRSRFGDHVRLSLRRDCRLVRDRTNYALGPHTDTPGKLVALLFYLPGDDRLARHGTSIYVPRDPAFRSDGHGHLQRHAFSLAATMPFRPNSVFGFVRTDRSFHGVERFDAPDVVRDLLLYNLYAENVTRLEPPARAQAGP
jgi:hypothetical protein